MRHRAKFRGNRSNRCRDMAIFSTFQDGGRRHVGWIKMTLGTEVGLSPGDFVLDGDSAPSPKRGQSPLPNFQPMSIVAKRLDGSRWHLAWRWALVQATMC